MTSASRRARSRSWTVSLLVVQLISVRARSLRKLNVYATVTNVPTGIEHTFAVQGHARSACSTFLCSL